MWYVAFTLGLFGSLHCVGMCGPLVIAFGRTEGGSLAANVYSGVSYNLGRTLMLPCGLVYLALAGALASGGVWQGMLFMILFGLGTLPMLLAVILGYEWVSPTIRFQFRKVLPYVTLSFGLFLIYRGVVVDMPTELNFWEALRNPIMCH